MCWGCLGKGFPPANWEMWTSPCREIGGCRRLRGKLTSWRCRYVLFKMMNMGIFYGHVNLFEGYVIHWFSFSRMLWKNSCINTVYLEMPTRHYSTWQKTSCIVDTFIYIYMYIFCLLNIYIYMRCSHCKHGLLSNEISNARAWLLLKEGALKPNYVFPSCPCFWNLLTKIPMASRRSWPCCHHYRKGGLAKM